MFNIGTYRVMVQDKNHVSVKMNMGKHGRLSFERARDADKPLPIAITLGQGPAVFLAAQMPLPPDVNEFEFAGYSAGRAGGRRSRRRHRPADSGQR